MDRINFFASADRECGYRDAIKDMKNWIESHSKSLMKQRIITKKTNVLFDAFLKKYPQLSWGTLELKLYENGEIK